MFGSQKQTIVVEGMMCAHCAARVEEGLGKLPGVKAAKVDLPTKTVVVTVKKPLSAEEYEKAITDLGYKFVEVAQ